MEQLFQPAEMDQITQFPVNPYGTRDKLIWGVDRKGLFTVKSAYQLAFSMRNKSQSGNQSYRDENEKYVEKSMETPS